MSSPKKNSPKRKSPNRTLPNNSVRMAAALRTLTRSASTPAQVIAALRSLPASHRTALMGRLR